MKKFDWRRSLITVAIVLVTAGVVGGTVWYLMDKNASDIKLSTDSSIQTLENQIKNLQERADKTITTASQTADWKTFNSTRLGLSFKYPSNYKVIDCTNTSSEQTQYVYLTYVNSSDTCNDQGPTLLSVTGFIEKTTLDQNYKVFSKETGYQQNSLQIARKNSIQFSYRQVETDPEGKALIPNRTRTNLETDVPMTGTKYATFNTSYISSSADSSLVQLSFEDTYRLILSTLKFSS